MRPTGRGADRAARRARPVGRPRRRMAGRGARLPTRSRSARGASGRCSCAACRRASSRSRATPEPFLSDELRRELAAVRRAAAAPARGRARPRAVPVLRLRLARHRARVLSYRSSDEEGNLALPSPFLDDVAELLPSPTGPTAGASGCWPTSCGRPRWRPTAWRAGPHRGRGGRAGVRRGPLADGSLGEAALRHVRHSQILSGGALETYGDCPVKWLVERELQPARLEPDPDPSPGAATCTRCSSR